MRVLVVNAGSSSLKHALVEEPGGRVLDAGVERWDPGGGAPRHGAALRAALAGAAADGVDAVGHRV
ncbi:MAG: acetate kinase, partial [Solirubrobacteraceae bacterium]|nr:acetate kinase [Solirubrobacteraceae bacterium]